MLGGLNMPMDAPPVYVPVQEYKPFKVFKGKDAKELAEKEQKISGGYVSTDGTGKWFLLYIPKVEK